MNSKAIIPVILCGGSGTRLWPLSRESFPKQFLSINNNAGENKSLLQKTQLRISKLADLKDPILVCNEMHRFIVAEQMREINLNNFTILLEPFGKNTAPAIALAALKAKKIEKESILLVLSSDHEIINQDKFLRVIEYGLEYANKDRLVTFGIVPSSPETGYGYIKATNPLIKGGIKGSNIDSFLEKPNLNTAKELIKDKRYTWNSGMFMFKTNTILKEIEQYSPQIIKNCKSAIDKSIIDLDFQRIDKKEFEKCENISIDLAVMEKTEKGTVLPLEAGWSDIGSWKAVWETSKKDINGNAIQGKVITQDAKNCYLRSENRLLVGIGIKDLIIVETSDAVLISDKNNSQKVKKIVKELKNNKFPEGQNHRKIYRPWGHYLSVVEDLRWQVKLIHVKPGEKLSLQMHHHRSEHWVVVKGTAQVELDNNIDILAENESIYIPLGSKHRLSNPGKIPLTLIEVQSGSYVGEDDIVRFQDKYGRST
tara:strand:+ start:7133 stop:8578 length:1446 start_codon:yes stop_codon:yes gene_type:complete